LFVFLLILLDNVQAQDSTFKKMKVEFMPNVWMMQNFEKEEPISLPSVIKDNRNFSQNFPVNLDQISDNPLRHGALYFELKTVFRYADKVKLNLDLYAEHRGSSYGLFDKNSLQVIPVFDIEAKDTIEIFQKSLKLTGEAGYFLNEKLNEGATIDNVDAEGFRVGVELDKWFLKGIVYGDFSNGIGLQLDDVYALTLTKKFGKKDSSAIGISFAEYKKLQPFINNYILGVFGHTQFRKLNLYAELNFRLDDVQQLFYNRGELAYTEKMAALIGANYNYCKNRFSFSTNFEARYYGAIFNEDYFDYRLRYRNIDGGNYANTVGKFIYPLRKFDTPFSQWSVYTEYAGSHVFSLCFRGQAKYDLAEKFFLHLAYDLNYIYANNVVFTPNVSSSFLYPFFTASINYRFIKEAEVGFIFTNKGMNLDISYPTQYLFTNPLFGIKLMTHF
jgi:hypothetical protein